MIRIISVIIMILSFSFLSGNSCESEEEALFVRRIVEFWRDEEYQLVKSQISTFFEEYPDSSYREKLLLMLGDTYFHNNNYNEALSTYNEIHTQDLRDKTLINRLHSLYSLKDFPKLIEELSPFFHDNDSTINDSSQKQLFLFYYAEGLFRQALEDDNEQKKNATYNNVEPLYKKLLSTSYDDNARQALAEIYRFIGKHESSAQLFMELAESHPKNREELLFNAATMQTFFDKNLSYSTFSRVLEIDGDNAGKAAFNCLVLLFEIGHFQDMIQSYQNTLAKAMEENPVFVHYLIGRSYFALHEYESSLNNLQIFVEKESNPSLEKKTALLTIIADAYYLDNSDILDTTLDDFDRTFPLDPEIARALFFQGLAYKKHKKFQNAQLSFARIISDFPDFSDRESAHFERNISLFQQSLWQESHDAFTDFITIFPNSHNKHTATRYALNTSLFLLDQHQDSDADSINIHEQLAEDITRALETPDVLSSQELPEYTLTLAKTLYELKHYDRALNALRGYLKDFYAHEGLYRAHFLIALCYYEAFQDIDAFTFHAEQVLALNPDVPEKSSLQLNLFNAYLQQSQEVSEEHQKEKEELLGKAAKNLYASVISGDKSIKQENMLWLANYYYGKAKNNLDNYGQKIATNTTQIDNARKSLEVFYATIDTDNIVTTTDNKIALETEIVKITNLLGWLNKKEKQIALLEKLRIQQTKNPDFMCKLHSHVLFSLGIAYEQINDTDNAISSYNAVTSSSHISDPYITNASKLLLARLSFKTLSYDDKNKNNTNVISILNLLKDVKIHKSLPQEPLHLEAAIDYSDIQALLEPEEKHDEHLLFLLRRVKEDFTSRDDIWSKDYHARRELMPEKDIVYQSYIMLLDARIAYLRSKIALKKNLIAEAQDHEETSTMIFKALTKGKFAVSQYLVEQAENGLGAIETNKHPLAEAE